MPRLVEPKPLSQEIIRRFEELRDERGLRAVSEEEDGTGVDKLPAGVYGFTYSPAEENFPLFRARELRTYESHKLKDGSVILLGFLTAEDAEKLETASQSETIHLFAEPKDQVDRLAEVPMKRVLGRVEYSQRGGKGLELSVGPAAE